MRKHALLAFSLPLTLLGCLAGHAAGYALAGSSRRDALVHSYLAYAPQFLAVCVAILVLAIALRVSGGLGGRPAAWPFALVPPLAFLGQEVIERVVAGLPADAVLAPPVYAGLAAQLPVALIAYLAARALIGAADAGGLALANRQVAAVRAVPLPAPATLYAVAGRPSVFDRPGRAPPLR